jgi:hypothetical protein
MLLRIVTLFLLSSIVAFGGEQGHCTVYSLRNDELSMVLAQDDFLVSPGGIRYVDEMSVDCCTITKRTKLGHSGDLSRAIYSIFPSTGQFRNATASGQTSEFLRELLKQYSKWSMEGPYVFYNLCQTEGHNFTPTFFFVSSLEGSFTRNDDNKLDPNSGYGTFRIVAISSKSWSTQYDKENRRITSFLFFLFPGKDEIDRDFAAKIEKSIVYTVGFNAQNGSRGR